MEEVEVWRDIPGFVGRYQVSSHGRVKSLARSIAYRIPSKHGTTPVEATRRERILRKVPAKGGYYQVTLHKDGAPLSRQIQTIVCEAFNGPRPEGYQCAHLNGNPKDNRVENLIWATRKENQRHSIMHGTKPCGASHPKAKLTEDQVRQIRAMSAAGVNSAQIGRSLGLGHTTVYAIVSGRTWAHLAQGTGGG